MALFSSGGSATSSSSDDDYAALTHLTDFWTSGSSYDPNELTPSLDTGAAAFSSVTSLVPDFAGSSFVDEQDSSSTPGVSPVKFLGCRFSENHAKEDGGAICESGEAPPPYGNLLELAFDLLRSSRRTVWRESGEVLKGASASEFVWVKILC